MSRITSFELFLIISVFFARSNLSDPGLKKYSARMTRFATMTNFGLSCRPLSYSWIRTCFHYYLWTYLRFVSPICYFALVWLKRLKIRRNCSSYSSFSSLKFSSLMPRFKLFYPDFIFWNVRNFWCMNFHLLSTKCFRYSNTRNLRSFFRNLFLLWTICCFSANKIQNCF